MKKIGIILGLITPIIPVGIAIAQLPVEPVCRVAVPNQIINGDFSDGLNNWNVAIEAPLTTTVQIISSDGPYTNVLDINNPISDGDGDWDGVWQTLNLDVSGFSELYFEADGKAIYQSLPGGGWVGGEYPVHFIIQYTDVNGNEHDWWTTWPPFPPNKAWVHGLYYLGDSNYPTESTKIAQDTWYRYKSDNLMNLSPAPKVIKTVRLYSSGWAYHGRIDNAQLYGVKSCIPVKIDIKPGSYPNSINLNSHGLIPVAILGSSIDVTTIDQLSVRFGPAQAQPVAEKKSLEDVDGDGVLDLVLHFKTKETGIASCDTQASLTGKTFTGVNFSGTDSVQIVPRDSNCGKTPKTPGISPD